MESIKTKVNGFYPLPIVAELSILGNCGVPRCASDICEVKTWNDAKVAGFIEYHCQPTLQPTLNYQL